MPAAPPATLAESLQARLAEAVSGISADLPPGFVPEISPAQNPRFGDYQSNAAMVLGKAARSNPRELAAEIIAAFPAGNLCQAPEIAGPGFINFRLTRAALEAAASGMLADPVRLGVAPDPRPRAIVVDFSAPNVAKPMHVGHIRSTIIGDCLVRVARFLGHQVIADNHIGDWGTQFGMILWGWKHLLDAAALESDPVGELLRVYREVNARQKDDETLRDTCKAELVKLQAGDPENLAIWERCVDLSKRGLQRIYDQLGVRFDHWLGESHYNDRLAPLVESLLSSGIAAESDGAICVFFPEDEALADKPCLVRKSDGGYLYATTDLATIDHRVEAFGAEAIWYVVGAPQQLHFDQIFAVARKRGVAADLRFIPFGSILGKDRKMLRTRAGETVQLAEVLADAVERAKLIIEEKNPGLPGAEKAAIASAIGIGAVKYAELSQFRMTDYVFDWDTMLSLKGNTAPYLINAYVRSRAVFRKLGQDFDPGGGSLALAEEAERALALQLARFAEAVPGILADFRPNALASYLYDLATTFHSFYERCPILSSEGETRHTRLALCELTARVLAKGLGLLGIETVERM